MAAATSVPRCVHLLLHSPQATNRAMMLVGLVGVMGGNFHVCRCNAVIGVMQRKARRMNAFSSAEAKRQVGESRASHVFRCHWCGLSLRYLIPSSISALKSSSQVAPWLFKLPSVPTINKTVEGVLSHWHTKDGALPAATQPLYWVRTRPAKA